jgi:hypothetical protein
MLLIERRTRHRTWVYVIGAALSTLLVVWCIGDLGAPAHLLLWALVPLSIFILQIIFPTILGWCLISLPFALYTLMGVSYLLRDLYAFAFLHHSLNPDFVGGIVVVSLLIGVSALLITSFPKKLASLTRLDEKAKSV